MTSSSIRFQELVQVMRGNNSEGTLGSDVGDEQIQQCEARLGVVLPESYRRFLREFTYAHWPDTIYGISPGLLPGLDLVQKTEKLRHSGRPNLPQYLVPFSPDGWGNHYCLDTSQLRQGECPVVFWNHERDQDQQPQQTQATFVDWLDEAIRRRLEFDAEESAPAG
jgi:cell wall assembly regulator SMI1